MLRKRMLFLVGGCLLAASGAWADDIGYVDCASHSDDTPVFSKARKSPDQVASIPCGERFTILLNGFIFSRIETKDGKVGYVYSNFISFDRGAISVRQADTGHMVEATSKVVIPSVKSAQPKPAPQTTPAQTIPAQPVFPQPAAAPVTTAASDSAATPAVPSSAPAKTAPAPQPTSDALAQAESPAAQPISPDSPTPAGQAAPATAATDAAAVRAAPAAATVTTDATPAASSPVVNPAAGVPETTVKTEDPGAAAPHPQPEAAPQPEPAAAQPEPAAAEPAGPAAPAPPPIRDASARTSWEKPNPGARQTFAIELYGGYAFAWYVNGGSGNAFNGGMGAFGWNIKPWIQIAGDSSYSYATISGTSNVLYGNHYGPRYFFRKVSRWGITPFVEGLVGGTRAQTTVSGPNGYTDSQNCISYKVGGGIDIRYSRHLEIRLFDVDYYRTAFGTNGTNLHQNNYWASAGIVLRLFGGGHE